MSTEHYIGPTATSSVDENADMLEVFKRLGGSHQTKLVPAHQWEPDFSEGEPALDSIICGLCGCEHGASAESGLAQQEPSHE